MRRFGRRVTRLQSVPADHRKAEPPIDADQHTRRVIAATADFTLTPHARVMALVGAVRHVVTHNVSGAIVECGVWRGGSMMAAAMTLLEQGDTSRDLYLFDTFTAMPASGPQDYLANGLKVVDLAEGDEIPSEYAFLPLGAVRDAMLSTGYPPERMHFVQGMVEDTIPVQAPAVIALCRLDTDYYASTKHELEHLYPRIAAGGALIIDDYGHFLGAKQAVDEYFPDPATRPHFHRVDYSARLLLKP